MAPVTMENGTTPGNRGFPVSQPPGYLELIRNSGHTCGMVACHRIAILRLIEYRDGREWLAGWFCGDHGAILYGKLSNERG